MADDSGSPLGDVLAGAFGHGVNRAALNNFVAQGQALNGLRTAQTEVALNNAQAQQEEQQASDSLLSTLTNEKDAQGNLYRTPSQAAVLRDMLVGKYGNAQQVFSAQRTAQQTQAAGVLGNPNATLQDQRAAGQQFAGKVLPQTEAVASNYIPAVGATPPPIQQSPQGAAQTANTQSQTALRNAQTAAGGFRPPNQQNGALSDDAAYNAAIKYNMSGMMPSLGMGSGGARAQILNFAAQLSANPNWHPPSFDASADAGTQHPTLANATGLLGTAAGTKGNAAIVTDMSKRAAIADASEQTALQNLNLAASYLTKVDQTGSPLINSVLNKIRAGVTGDPDVSAFQNSLETASNEYARVVSMATGAQGITDAARREGEQLFNTSLSPAQLQANIQAAQTEMNNRTGSLHDQIVKARRSLSKGSPVTDALNNPVDDAGNAAPASPSTAQGWGKVTQVSQ